jgi:hypothetical protein
MNRRAIIWALLASLGFSASMASESAVITAAVARNIQEAEMRPSFERLLAAIRKAENGREARAFGIMHPAANCIDSQAGWCAATCRNTYARWLATDQSVPFLVYLRDRYAPLKSDNDPTGLNKNWLKNVVFFLHAQEGLTIEGVDE